jgi:hypothetical protein
MNRAEGTIRELKRATRRAMLKAQTPKRLWDYCIELQAKIQSNTAHDITTLGGQTPETLMGGETADILDICDMIGLNGYTAETHSHPIQKTRRSW